MLSPDVPEFIPRGYQTPESTNTVNFKSKESTNQSHQTKPQPSTHRPPLHARSNPFDRNGSPLRQGGEKTFGLRKQNNTWRQPREEFGNWRDSQIHEVNRHESGTEPLSRNYSSMPKKKLPENQISQKSKGRGKTVSENLELHIKNKFITTSNPSSSYTKILKSKQPANNTPEGKPSKQEFSFSTDDQWPTLGESLPLHKMPERSSELTRIERSNNNPWLSKSNEGSPTPMKRPVENPRQERVTIERDAGFSVKSKITEINSPTKHRIKKPANPWQERGTIEWDVDASVRPKITEINSPTKRPIKKSANPWQERGTTEQKGDASVRPRSTEISSPIRKPIKVLANAWQEGSTAEQIAKASVQPRITDGNPETSENHVKTNPASQTPLKKIETDSPVSDNNRLESKSTNLSKEHSDKHDNETGTQKSNGKNAMNNEAKNSLEMQSQVEAANVTRNTITQEDSDLFQWKVMGEKKKKVKLKKPQEEARGSPQLQELLRGNRNKYGRILPSKSSPNDNGKENQDYTSNVMKKCVLDLSKMKGVSSESGQETQGAIKKDVVTPKAGQKEKKKPRPTKVMSLANCSNDKKETKLNPKIVTTTAATKPVDEQTLQRRLAAKLFKKEEKRKLKEMKARGALKRPKDTKVSFITTNFLEKAQMPNKTSIQPSSQTTTSTERMNFTLEEYPTLQMQRYSTPSLPSHRETHQNTTPSFPSHKATQQNTTPSFPSDKDASQASSSSLLSNTKHKPILKITKKSPSTKGKLQADDLLSGLLPHDGYCSDNNSDASEECAITYRKALLSAREKATIPDWRRTKLATESPIDTAPQKKKVRTKDPIELDLFALAAQSGRNKKKEAIEKLSPPKRRFFEDEREEEVHARKTVVAAPPKAAVVVAKRGKINAKKPKKKKISRVQRCKIEKRQREVLALQLLLEQAKHRQQQQQQGFLEVSPTTETEESTKDAESVKRSENTSEPLDSVTKTEADKERDERRPGEDEDEEKQDTSIEKTEEKIEDSDENKENETSIVAPHSLPNINCQAEGDGKPKLTWRIKGIQYPITKNETQDPEENSNSETKDKNSEEGTSSQQSTEEEHKSSHSPTHQKLLADDPLIAEKASELIELIKSQNNKRTVHREYCHQVVTPEVNSVAKKLITSLITFQNRHYQRDPTKARIRKRYVCGLKETTKLMGKMSCVIMAPNIQQCEGPGSLDDAVEKLLNQAEKLKVPVVFALSTKGMKYLCRKSSSRKVSCFGIISYQGAQDLFQEMMQLLPEAQKQYQQLVASGQCTLPKEGEEEEEGEVEPTKQDLTQEVLTHTSSLLMAP